MIAVARQEIEDALRDGGKAKGVWSSFTLPALVSGADQYMMTSFPSPAENSAQLIAL